MLYGTNHPDCEVLQKGYFSTNLLLLFQTFGGTLVGSGHFTDDHHAISSHEKQLGHLQCFGSTGFAGN